MSQWPDIRLRDYINGSEPPIDGDDLNAMQDEIRRAYGVLGGRCAFGVSDDLMEINDDLNDITSDIKRVGTYLYTSGNSNRTISLDPSATTGMPSGARGVATIMQTAAGSTSQGQLIIKPIDMGDEDFTVSIRIAIQSLASLRTLANGGFELLFNNFAGSTLAIGTGSDKTTWWTFDGSATYVDSGATVDTSEFLDIQIIRVAGLAYYVVNGAPIANVVSTGWSGTSNLIVRLNGSDQGTGYQYGWLDYVKATAFRF